MPITIVRKQQHLSILDELKHLANPKYAQILAKFFKTGKGEYGEGDLFLGIKTAPLRSVALHHTALPLPEIFHLLRHPYHEARALAAMILVRRYRLAFKQKDTLEKDRLAKFYMQKAQYFNNWDLVDMSCPQIIGTHLLHHPAGNRGPRKILYEWSASSSLWKRRMSIVATLTFIRNNDFKDTLRIAKIHLKDEEDLMHKAVGWMLREMGKRDEKPLRHFLDQHCEKMPRTMLRYSIEKFHDKLRKYYLHAGRS